MAARNWCTPRCHNALLPRVKPSLQNNLPRKFYWKYFFFDSRDSDTMESLTCKNYPKMTCLCMFCLAALMACKETWIKIEGKIDFTVGTSHRCGGSLANATYNQEQKIIFHGIIYLFDILIFQFPKKVEAAVSQIARFLLFGLIIVLHGKGKKRAW